MIRLDAGMLAIDDLRGDGLNLGNQDLVDPSRRDGTSNCPLCAIGHDANKTKIWAYKDMDADHVSAWSRGGATSSDNCQMLCRTHNQSKGNR